MSEHYQGSIVQFKLLNGDDMLAEMVESSIETFIVKNALIMEPLDPEEYEVNEPSKSFYLLRPFISYTDDLENSVSLNPVSVVCVTVPSPMITEQYMGSVEQIQTELMLAKQEWEPTSNTATKDPSTTNVVSINRKRLLTEESE